LCFDIDKVEKDRLSLGRFVLSTNMTQLSASECLKFYKEQSKVENCFRFIKSNDLRISDILLKKIERIQRLCCFMALIMLISALLELMLRDGLKKNATTISGYGNKQTDNPTLKFAFDKFKDFCCIISYQKSTDSVELMIPINAETEMLTILEAFGDSYLEFYNYISGKVLLNEAGYIINNFCYVNEQYS
jgi:transposase